MTYPDTEQIYSFCSVSAKSIRERFAVAKIFCNNEKCNYHKCLIDQTFVIVPKNKKYKFAFLYTSHCPVCKKHYTLIINYEFIKEGESKLKRTDKGSRAFGCFKPVEKLFTGKKADEIFENIYEGQKAVLYEVMKNLKKQKSGFYLKYSEYGKIKRCYSNLSTLKLGKTKNNFEDIEDVKSFLFK